MIITRTPFRVSFCGGGSDLKEFYEQHEGCVLSTSITKYMYISIHPYFEPHKISLKYSRNETVDRIEDISHQIFKEALSKFDVDGVEITSTADIPAGTGLGSSSTFTSGLLNALYAYTGKYVSKARIAEEACDIEINRLHSPIGKQDQYAAACGGLNFIRFLQSGEVVVEPVICKGGVKRRLQNNLMMFYTGDVRSANSILAQQADNMKQIDKVQGLIKMCELAKDLKYAVETGDLHAFGEILDENWQIKRSLAGGISNTAIDNYYDIAMKNGARGGKLLGAGGGGFLLFYCEEEKQEQLRNALGLREMKFEFDNYGTSVIFVGDKYW